MAQPLSDSPRPPNAASGRSATSQERLARVVREQLGFTWRFLRGVGLTESEADAGLGQVFEAAAARLSDIRLGNERAFLFSTALHVASRLERARGEQAALPDAAPALEELDEREQAREILSVLLNQLPLELRVVFALQEIEGLSESEIAGIAGIAPATVAARASEAQDEFATHLESGGEFAESLLDVARTEPPPSSAVERTLRAVGLDSLTVPAEFVAALRASTGATPDTDAVSAVGVLAAPADASASSALMIAAKWLLVGLIAGVLALAGAYALHAALASPSAAR